MEIRDDTASTVAITLNRSIASNSVQLSHSIVAAEHVEYEKASAVSLMKFLGKVRIEVF